MLFTLKYARMTRHLENGKEDIKPSVLNRWSRQNVLPPRCCDYSFAFREVPPMTATEAGTLLFVIIMLVPFIAER
jgi:hypothetical protein